MARHLCNSRWDLIKLSSNVVKIFSEIFISRQKRRKKQPSLYGQTVHPSGGRIMHAASPPNTHEQKSSPPNAPHQEVISNTHNQNHLSQGKKLLHKRSCHVTSSLPALYFRRPHRNPDRQYFFGVVSAYLCRTTRGCEQFTVNSSQPGVPECVSRKKTSAAPLLRPRRIGTSPHSCCSSLSFPVLIDPHMQNS